MMVKVSDLTVVCMACDEPVTREEVAAVADRWIALFRWIDQAGK